ncbi:BamA/TamA family outer membrane protein [Hymenobacter sp. RP-2-7]|uniref:BamA/TamA family outer membrane protein n=1 Tax=Hymenobacter polaris TaxID=2682546 RepID=A0A7Y0FL76_9BACT|nr:BamA/TamA family outer membrane protein [Hymenobacter polaris]NML64513.1 BamA/TamA family outer membrane protein [Hymenobacter polaris]
MDPQSNDHPRRRGAAGGRGLLALVALWLAVGCSPLRLLAPNERLLTKVTIESDGLTTAQQERMLTLVQQKPNRNLPLPRLAIYQLGHSFYDSARIKRHIARIQAKYADKIAQAGTDSARVGRLADRRDRRLARKRTALNKGNAIMRLGEPPVLYDPTLSARTVEQLKTYLHSQGYFRAQVSYFDTARAKRSPGGIVRNLLGSKPVRATPLRDSLTGQRLYRRVAVTYEVKEGPEFTLSQLARIVPDSGVARVIAQSQTDALLHRGDAYNEDAIGLERQRLETLLKNAGYYDFRAQLISFEADTSFEKQQVRLRMLLASPPGGLRRYRLRQVTLLTDVSRARALRATAGDTARLGRRSYRQQLAADTAAARVATNANRTGRISTANLPAGVTPAAVSDSMTASRLRRTGRRVAPRDTVRQDSVLIASRGPLEISPKVLVRQVPLRPGQLYNLTRTQRAQRQLSALDMFQFNTVTYRKVAADSRVSFDNVARDTTNADVALADTLRPALGPPRPPAALESPTGFLDATITTSPSPRFSETTEFGGTYVADKVGPFGNLRLKWRNPFGGAEVLELSARAGLEGQLARLDLNDATNTSSLYTLQYGASAALVVPQFLVPFGLGNFLRNDQPRTRFSVSNNYTKTPYYTRSNTEATLDYLWQPSVYQQYIFTPLDIGIVSTPFVSEAYQAQLDTLRIKFGSPLYQSFRNIYEPSFSFSSIFNSNDINQTRSAHYFRWFVELGGLTRGLYRDAGWFKDTGLSVYNFYKVTADYRQYYKLSPTTYLAWRLNGGIAQALTATPPAQAGDSEYIIPYDKFLFAGGSNSVRAWAPRRLGIGSFATTKPDGTRDYVTEQPGNVLLEGSVEYRFPLYSFINGAVFTDFGNVWSLQPDDRRPGAKFQLDSFYKQFAVASGFGLRMDFTFIILRFDIATKVYDPTVPDAPWRLREAIRTTTNQTIINVGIGYPF